MIAAGAAPQNSVPPTVSGTPTEGQTLVGADGTWAGAATIAFTYAWSRCDATGAACAPIAGATAKTYILAAADIDKSLRLAVTAKNTLGSQTQTSAPTAEVARLAPASVVTLPSGGKSIDATDVKLPALLDHRQGLVLAESAAARGRRSRPSPRLGYARRLGAHDSCSSRASRSAAPRLRPRRGRDPTATRR